MKKFKALLYISSILLLVSCGEDRSGEYFALVNDDIWIENTMKEHYLWNNELPTVSSSDYFAAPSDFLSKLLFKGDDTDKADSYSYIEEKASTTTRSYLQRSSSYGFDFELFTDPTGLTNHTYARVLFVLPNSPASEGGLLRGDWISQVNDNNLNSDNYGYLISGGESSFTLVTLNDEDGTLSWSSDKTITLASSRQVEINPFYVDTTYVVDNKKISYLVYNEFSSGPNDDASDTQYLQQMEQIFSRFKSESPDAFILDLRYNPGGYLSQAINLGSMIAPASALGKTFYTLQYNSSTSPQNVSANLRGDLSSYNLNLKTIYIITSGYTASASEALINCLKPYMGDANVILIGETTYGKNVAMSPFTTDELSFILWPVVAYVKNSEGFYQYSDGISPTVELSEKNLTSRLLPLGDTDEYLLKNTISYIINGNISNSVSSVEENNKSLIYSSIYSRRVKGSRIK